jgi:hypothetical protein
MYAENDILFPYHAIAALRRVRGEAFSALVERVLSRPETHEDTIAFMLMMVRLNGCMACETDSYRAMRGCVACAQQTLKRFKGEDSDLIELFERALVDVRRWASANPDSGIISSAV